MDGSAEQRTIFISYAITDRPWATWMAQTLRRAGHTVFLPDADTQFGTEVFADLNRALASADLVLLVVSPAYTASAWADREWRSAASVNVRIAPVIVASTSLPPSLASRVGIDLVGLDEDAACRALLDALGSADRPAAEAPPEVPTAPFPGAAEQRVISNLEPGVSPFVGRAEALRQITELLGVGDPTLRIRSVALTGGAGSGKSETARRFAELHADAYDVMWWVRASDRRLARADLAALGAALDPRQPESVGEGYLWTAQCWLETHARWLLVLDDATTPEDARELLPAGAVGGHVLVTSRRRSGWGGLTVPIEIDALSMPDAVQLLTARSGDDDREAATRLADELDRLPLALAQAAAYAATAGTTLAGVTARLDEESRVHDRLSRMTHLAFDAVREDRDASAILFCSAFLADGRIPIALFATTAAEARLGLDRERCESALRVLAQFALVILDNDDQGFYVHVLLKQLARKQLDAAETRRWAETVQLLVASALADDLDDGDLALHGLAVANALRDLGAESVTTAMLLVQLGLGQVGVDDAAQATLERALEISRETPGVSTRLMVAAANGLASAQRASGDLWGARMTLESVVFDARYAPDETQLATALWSYGMLLRDQGELPGAIEALRRAADVTQQFDDPRLRVAVLANLGLCYRDVGDSLQAREGLSAALAVSQGLDPATEAAIRSNLGLLLQDIGDLPAAAEHLEAALALSQAIGDDRQTTTALSNLGSFFLQTGDYEQALRHFERAVELAPVSLGPDHPRTASVIHGLATAKAHLGQTADARSAFMDALAIMQRAYGPDDHRVRALAKDLDLIAPETGAEAG